MKWVTNWSNSISIRTNEFGMYNKNVTLRYPIKCIFQGEKIRITLDNFTGLETAHFAKVSLAKSIKESEIDLQTLKTITFAGKESIDIARGERVVSDEIDFSIKKGESFSISMYFDGYISLRPAVLTYSLPVNGYYGLGDLSVAQSFPKEISKGEAWTYYLSDIELLTEDYCQSIMAFGDSITAQNWPDELQKLTEKDDVAIARKAVSGARVLHQYSNLEYESYGLKSSIRFDHDNIISGCKAVVILEGVNDLIHPVGIEVNPFRPMSDFPTVEQLVDGYRYLIRQARAKGLKVFISTILPIEGWRTYQPFRNERREEVNHWIRTTDEIDGFIDFDLYMKDETNPACLKSIYDSGDHLHPSVLGHQRMAEIAYEALKKYDII